MDHLSLWKISTWILQGIEFSRLKTILTVLRNTLLRSAFDCPSNSDRQIMYNTYNRVSKYSHYRKNIGISKTLSNHRSLRLRRFPRECTMFICVIHIEDGRAANLKKIKTFLFYRYKKIYYFRSHHAILLVLNSNTFRVCTC